MTNGTCSLSALRFALNHLYELKALQASPLIAAVKAVKQGSAPAALRHTLIQAIASLKPDDDTPPQSLAWRSYEILHYRYVQQCNQLEVADQLGLSVRHLKREQHKAIELLAQHLCERFGFRIELTTGAEGEAGAQDEDEETPLAGALPLPQEPSGGGAADLGALLSGVLELVRPLAARYQVEIKLADLGTPPSVAGNPVVLRQILLGLLCVAVRHTRERHLLIASDVLPRVVKISVQGVSLSPTSALLAEGEANLEMARQLAGHAGATLTLPAMDTEDTITLLLPAIQQVRVLVVDDHLDALQLFERYASDTRYRIFGAQDAGQALSLAGEVRPQVIVLDVMLPEVDGWELLARLRQHPLTGEVPVIACTILPQEELAFSLGASAFLRKPVSRQEFLATLDRVIREA